MVDQANFLALELVPAALFFGNRLDDGVCRHPVGASNREVPFEDCTIRAFTAAIAYSDDWDFVDRGFSVMAKVAPVERGCTKLGFLLFKRS